MKVLYVEDEGDMALIVSERLRFNGFEVSHFNSPIEGLAHFKLCRPDIVILDVMLPWISGIDLGRIFINIAAHIPIIFVSAKTNLRDITEAFEAGGSDYLRKPFIIEELIMRIRALLRVSMYRDCYQIGQFYLDYKLQHLVSQGRVRKLSCKESVILQQLALNVGKVMPRDILLKKLCPNHAFLSGRSLDVYVCRLRSYLKEDPKIRLQAIKKVGYRLAIEF